MMDQNEELNNYLMKEQGISRTSLNVMAFIGLFIFGWLIAVVFQSLGKGKQGLTYLISIVVLYFGVSPFAPELAVFVPLIYIVAWVHANGILSRYQTDARRRHTEIEWLERRRESGIDTLLEKGLILHKVFHESDNSIEALNGALRLSGGDPHLLNQAGLAMSANRRYAEADQFFDRALSRTQDKALIKQIKRSRRSIEKKVAQVAGRAKDLAFV